MSLMGRAPSRAKLRRCRDANGAGAGLVYFEDEPGRCSAAHLMTLDEARRIAANIAKLRDSSACVVAGRI